MSKRYKFILFSALSLLMSCNGGPSVEEMKTWHDPEQTIVMEEFQAYEEGDSVILHGTYKKYDEEGKLEEESSFIDGQRDGLRKLYLKGVLVVSESYTLDKYHGPYSSYFDNGNPKEEGRYQDDKLEGEWKYYYESGEIKEIVQYKGGSENGAYQAFHQNGKLKAEGQYLNEKEDGDWKFYYESGKLEEVANFKNGWEEGVVIVLTERGDTMKKIQYENGRVKSFKEFDVDTSAIAP